MSHLAVTVEGIESGEPIPERFARCVADGAGQSRAGENIRPAIRWSGAPSGTRSFAIIVVDKDVPTRFDDANKPDKTLPADMPRRNFYHWLQTDIPADVAGLPEGRAGRVEPGMGGCNSFSGSGTDRGLGYDGPCPPWNDERLHRYHFQVYALDAPSLGLKANATGEEVEKAMQGHILATGEVVGSYATNRNMQRAA